jgi:ketosteroid isomerase-like protein
VAGNTEVAKETYEAFGRGDVEAVLGNFSPEVEWHAAEGLPWGGVHRGSQTVAENVFGPLLEAYEVFTLTPERYIESGDTVVVLGRYSGKGKASGKPLDAAFAHVWNFENGKLREFNHYADTAKLNEAMT